jgi:hypothetical protein
MSPAPDSAGASETVAEEQPSALERLPAEEKVQAPASWGRSRHRTALTIGGIALAVLAGAWAAASQLGSPNRTEQAVIGNATPTAEAVRASQSSTAATSSTPTQNQNQTPTPTRSGYPSASVAAPAQTAPSASRTASTLPSPSILPSASAVPSVPATSAPASTSPGPGQSGNPSSGQAPVLQEGDRGPAVLEMQQRLKQTWAYFGRADGVYAADTRDAVARYQTWYQIKGDPAGVYGPNTRRALEAATVTP